MRKLRFSLMLVSVMYLFSANSSFADETPVKPCSAEQYRQFDFWVGDWVVHSPDGAKVGENLVEAKLAGCSVHESWRGASGSVGFSYTGYDQSIGKWVQNWTDNGGFQLHLEGNFVDGSMVLRGETQSKQGEKTQTTKNKVTWTAQDDGSVSQVWEISRDSGKTWNTIFHGIYTKKS